MKENETTSRSERRLRTAVVGLGRIGFKFHLPAIYKTEGFELVGAVDPLSDRRAEVEVKYNIPTFATLEDLLAAVKPDLVVIASPTPFHVEQACAAFAAGSHVFCDKPIATTSADFEVIAEASARTGLKFLAYQPARFRPEVQALRAILQKGILGEVYLVKRARCNFERRSDWQAFQRNGGGMLNNYGSHCLDEWISLFGDESVTSVHCQTRRVATAGDAEDVVQATLVNEKGRILDLTISQACALPGPEWHVMGSRGAAIYDQEEAWWRIRYLDPAETTAIQPQTGFAAAGRSYSSGQLNWQDHVVAVKNYPEVDYYASAWSYFCSDAAPLVTIEQSRLLLELIERCRSDAQPEA